jgi:DNA mismatch endonuclease (patch repair protein)
MAAVGGRDTAPEKTVRSMLHRRGLRFRLHCKTLPGTPDLVLTKHKTVVFVHGCFWHGHHCARGTPPATRRDFWLPKLEKNKLRDARQVKELRALGWRVLTVWECELKDQPKLNRRFARWFE